MATAIHRYNTTIKRIVNQDIDLSGCKVMLLNNSVSFDATDVTLVDVAGADYVNEVHGNGWDEGGVALTNLRGEVAATNGAMLDADDLEVVATGGPIGPAYFAVVYDQNEAPLYLIDFDGAKTADESSPFKIVWSSLGITRFTQAA